MALILNEFKNFVDLKENIKQTVKIIFVNFNFAVYVTNEDKVYSFVGRPFGYENTDNNYVLITELCEQNIQHFYCIDYFVFARSSDNKIFGSGRNGFGQLARGYCSDRKQHLKPQQINFFDDKNIIDISCGYWHCLALSSEGLVYGWGDNSRQQLNSSEESLFLTPVLINCESGVVNRVKHIHSCERTSVLVSFDGFVYILNPLKWQMKYVLGLTDVYKIYLGEHNINVFVLKNNGFIQLYQRGRGEPKTLKFSFESLINSQYFSNELIIETNEEIKGIDSVYPLISPIKQQNAFEYCLTKYESTIKSYHFNENCINFKHLEFNENKELFETNKMIEINVNKVHNNFNSRGYSMSLAKFGIFNALPVNIESNVKFYFQMRPFSHNLFSAIFVMNDNKVYGIGANNNGLLGLGHERRVTEYTLIEELCDQNIEEFFGYSHFVLARNNKNQIFGWGHNQFGQLGSGTTHSVDKCLKPKKIRFFDKKNIIEISCGFWHCLGLTETGVVYGWGRNDWAQTGNRINTNKVLTPIRVQLDDILDNRIKFTYCYGYTSCAVTVDGTAYLWGKVNGKKTVIPIIIETNVSKLNISFESNFSIKIMNENFKIYKNEKIIFDCEDVIDINLNNILKKDGVYEYQEHRNEMIKTNYSNLYEYRLYKHNIIDSTIHITSDGYLMRPTIQLNEKQNSNEKLLKKVFENIFDRKLENSFDIIQCIGEGTFGKVNQVKSKSTSIVYAIKSMQIKDFKKIMGEIKIMSELNSEYVVKYYNSWTEAKVIDKEVISFVYIQMKLCSQNLELFINLINTSIDDKFKTIKYFIRSELFIEIIECLNYLHSKNIIHRDLKPQNILINDKTNERFLKLCDFGLSEVYENSKNSRGVGTSKYMAPEIKDEDNDDSESVESHYNLKSDIYSLGVIATKLFDLKDSIKSIRKLTQIDKYSSLYSDTSFEEKFRKLLKEISLMLSKRPEERLSCSELLDKTHEWTVDTNTLRSDEYYNEFTDVLKNGEKLKIIQNFVELKLNQKRSKN